jgi:hypothetical protein
VRARLVGFTNQIDYDMSIAFRIMNYTILAATRLHLPHLQIIEKAAEILFPIEDLPESLRSINTSLINLWALPTLQATILAMQALRLS